MNIADLLAPADVCCGLKTTGRKRLLSELSAIAARGIDVEQGLVFEAVWEREMLGSTAVGRGVAIPHGRLVQATRIRGVFATLHTPVDFKAVDDVPVDLVFLLVTPSGAGADHLKALALVSRLLRQAGLCERLRAAENADVIYSLLTEPPAGFRAA
jgi:PTS system nitrogen regulatory IIA component